MSLIYVGSPQPQRGLFAGRVYHPAFHDREEPTPRLSQDGAREFDAVLGCWIAAPEPPPEVLPVKAAALPIGDGSGVWWDVREDGQLLWTIEAADFDRALAEKRRLCSAVGGKSGWAKIYRK